MNERLFNSDQKRLLALDGGGIMGVITLQLLKRMESQLREVAGNDRLVLSDFFDYIGGTSTGAIIATGLALGKPVDDLVDFYDKSGREMFQQAGFLKRIWRHAFVEGPLTGMLQSVIGKETLLEVLKANKLKSYLMICTHNETNDSAWPLTSNPRARYNDPNRKDCNLNAPLWQLVRASTAAPTFFRPEVIDYGAGPMQFVDGGITPFNNPSLMLFKKASLPCYKLEWPTGEKRMMLVSLGTGFARNQQKEINASGKSLLQNAKTIPGALMRGIAKENDFNCRVIGRCVYGSAIDREVGTLIEGNPPSDDLSRAFLYARYDADISEKGLEDCGLGYIDRSKLTMDNIEMMPELKQIGEKAAGQVRMREHFAPFMRPV